MFQFSLSGMNQMIKFNFNVQVGFVALNVGKTYVGQRIVHRNNLEFRGYFKAFGKGGKIIYEAFDRDGFLTTYVADEDKFMKKDRNTDDFLLKLSQRLLRISSEIVWAKDNFNFEHYCWAKDHFERFDQAIDYYEDLLK
jgi:hypothetical protein